MSGSGKIDWNGYNRKKMGRMGKSGAPYYNAALQRIAPSQKQIRYVEQMTAELESAGIKAAWILEGTRQWRVNVKDCSSVIYRLKKLRSEHLEGYGTFKPVYENLCRNLTTGERVKYKTLKRNAYPKGYELIGELCFYNAPPEERDRLPVIVHYVKKERTACEAPR